METSTGRTEPSGISCSKRRNICSDNSAWTVTRTALNFSVGKIVLHQNARLRIDLTPFYQSVAGRSETNVDLSLKEFFAKGIVGVVSRANQKYLTNNQARRKISIS